MINKVTLLGRLGFDPEVTTFENGISKASLRIATDDSYKNKEGEKVERTDWHRVVLWRGLAGIAEKYLRKGSLVYIEGKIKTRSYDDKEGKTRYITEVEGYEMKMLDSRNSNNSQSAPAPAATNNAAVTSTVQEPAPTIAAPEEDDLPF